MNDFLQRLKQRKLVQWAATYLTAAWVLLQVIDLASGSYHWPDSVMHIGFGVLAVGFLVALVLAWYHGERGAQRISGMELLIVALVLAVGGGLLWHFSREPAQGTATNAVAIGYGANAIASGATAAAIATQAPAAKSIAESAASAIMATPIPAKSVAVLPFENLSTDKGNAYFADGMQDLILTKLADIGDLKVISRTSTMKYASHPGDLKTIGRQLGVATILEGSVQKAGNQVLINVQLIDAKTDGHIWANSYTRTLTNIFGVEGEVAQKVADALKAQLTATEAQQVAALPTRNAQAYDAYLRGQYYENRASSSLLEADYAAAIASYAKATELDPHFVLAWLRLARNLSEQIHFNRALVDAPALAVQAKAAVQHLLALAPDTPEAHLAQGWYQYNVRHDLDAALATFKTAQRLQPNNPETLFAIGVINKRRGNVQAAITWYQKAIALDPRNVQFLAELSQTQSGVRDYTAAANTAKRAIAIDPSSATAAFYLAMAYRGAGDLDQAQAALAATPAAAHGSGRLASTLARLMLTRRNYIAARRLYAIAQPFMDSSAAGIESSRGDVEWYAGNRPLAHQHYQRAESLIETALKQNPQAPGLHDDLGWVYARLGRSRQALEQAELAIKLSSMDQDALVRMGALFYMTAIQTQIGRTADAIAGLDRLLTMPVGLAISVPLLKLDPTWDPIRHDPRFQTLLKKYASAQPVAAGTSATSSTQ